jgi:hypothetical protein
MIREIGYAALGLVGSAAPISSSAAYASDKVVAEISGRIMRVIDAARTEFPRGEDLKGYQITVVDTGALFVVHFSDPEKPAGFRGSSPNRPEFSVEVDKETLRAIRYIGVR